MCFNLDFTNSQRLQPENTFEEIKIQFTAFTASCVIMQTFSILFAWCSTTSSNLRQHRKKCRKIQKNWVQNNNESVSLGLNLVIYYQHFFFCVWRMYCQSEDLLYDSTENQPETVLMNNRFPLTWGFLLLLCFMFLDCWWDITMLEDITLGSGIFLHFMDQRTNRWIEKIIGGLIYNEMMSVACCFFSHCIFQILKTSACTISAFHRFRTDLKLQLGHG